MPRRTPADSLVREDTGRGGSGGSGRPLRPCAGEHQLPEDWPAARLSPRVPPDLPGPRGGRRRLQRWPPGGARRGGAAPESDRPLAVRAAGCSSASAPGEPCGWARGPGGSPPSRPTAACARSWGPRGRRGLASGGDAAAPRGSSWGHAPPTGAVGAVASGRGQGDQGGAHAEGWPG